ncbi:MAG TPA: chemotaxis protein CheW, partial [Coriobacteriia bacterium]|nr:chemotaxis protein CheW [Coriobacteriia bacterium]
AGAVALLVDAVDAVVTLCAEEAESAPSLHPLASRIRAVHRISGELVFVLDVDALLSPMGPGCDGGGGHE